MARLMYVARMGLLSIRGCLKDSRSPSLFTGIYEYVDRKSLCIFLLFFFSFVYSLIPAFSFPDSPLVSLGHFKYSKTSPRSLEIYFHLSRNLTDKRDVTYRRTKPSF